MKISVKYRSIKTRILLLVGLGVFFMLELNAQGNITFDLKKPKKFEDRKLASEMTPEGKISPFRRAKENIVTHYNFYFNAALKLSTVINSAKQSHKDTFSNLLPFYDVSLDQTAAQQQELDSVVIKTNNGILLHDLRNDWVDDLYLLMGQSYFFQKKFDSAYDVFQYINYNFQPRSKEERGYEKSIGSNLNTTGNVFTISSPEKRGIARKFHHNPIRNDALLWIIRSLIGQDNDDDARGLIETLYLDGNFPNRLQDQLDEIKAYWFYKRGQYDSAAHYLENAIGLFRNKTEKARAFFLIAQLHEKSGHLEDADRFYDKSVAFTTDPIMEAYARINQISLTTDEKNKDKKVDQNVKALMSMAGREKYLTYRPIIYGAAAEMEKSRGKTDAAIALLLKAIAFNSGDPGMKNQHHLAIAEMAFDAKQYELSKVHFDSINTDNLTSPEDVIRKKSVVTELATNIKIVNQEDSLQRIAFMPQDERDALLNALLKKLQKEQASTEQNKNQPAGSSKNTLLDNTTAALFSEQQKKGDWYFSNASLIAKGSIAFKNKWGERPNADNWRRSAATNAILKSNIEKNALVQEEIDLEKTPSELSIAGLTENIPLTQEALDKSNESKYKAYRSLGIIYKDKLDACSESVSWHEKLLSKRPEHPELEKILTDLYYCHKQLNNTSKESFYKDQLKKRFPDGLLTSQLGKKTGTKASKDSAVTKTYEKIYDLMLSGKFDNALQKKREADSTFGENNWSPQLLYIESIYYIKSKQDSLAIATLNKIPSLYPNSPLAEKAGLLADVVNRREEIEESIRNMDVKRVATDSVEWIDDSPLPKDREVAVKKDSTGKKSIEPPVIAKAKADTDALKLPTIEVKKDDYTFDPSSPHSVVLLMKDVDVVYINEAKRALAKYSAQKYPGNAFELIADKISDLNYIEIKEFKNAAEAINYTDQSIPAASREIFPWLPVEKYRFIIISLENKKRMIQEKNTERYIKFLQDQLPGKF
ncbi:MAG: tetratricopeptide repeat protein [bacterium]